MPHRVTYIIANVDRAVAFEWVVDLLDGDHFELDFILLNPGPSVLEDELAQRKIPCERVTYRGYRDLPGALWRVIRILRRTRPGSSPGGELDPGPPPDSPDPPANPPSANCVVPSPATR